MDLKNNKVTVGELMEHPGARAVQAGSMKLNVKLSDLRRA